MDVEGIAAQAQHDADRVRGALAAARDRQYEVTSPGGEVTVAVDGRPRITAVRFEPRAMRLDLVALGAILARTLDEALRTARSGTHDGLIDAIGPELGQALAMQEVEQ
jgi:DNA-binding protein YbaB